MDLGPVNDTIRLSQADLDAVLAELNRVGSASPAASKRGAKRWIMQSQKALITLVDANGNKLHHQVTPRNISKTGCSLLFGGFLHPKSKCFLTLRAVNGAAKSVGGVVVHCHHIRGRVHELGIRFATQVNPRDFFIRTGDEYLFHCEHVDLASLKGEVLLVDDSVAVQRLFAHYLSGSALELSCAENAADGLEAMKSDPNVALVDYQLPDMNGIDLVTQARAQGFEMPIILISAEHDKELRMAAFAAGASELLFKPLTPDLLHRALAEFLTQAPGRREAAAAGGVGKGVSPTEMNAYAATLRKQGQELQRALESGDATAVRTHLLDIQGTAPAFGFPYYAEKAREALKAVESRGGIEQASAEIRALARACEKAQAPAPVDEAA